MSDAFPVLGAFPCRHRRPAVGKQFFLPCCVRSTAGKQFFLPCRVRSTVGKQFFFACRAARRWENGSFCLVVYARRRENNSFSLVERFCGNGLKLFRHDFLFLYIGGLSWRSCRPTLRLLCQFFCYCSAVPLAKVRNFCRKAVEFPCFYWPRHILRQLFGYIADYSYFCTVFSESRMKNGKGHLYSRH